MGSKNYGAISRTDEYNFKPEDLKVITDPKHPLYDPRVERDFDEALVKSIMSHGVKTPLLVMRDGNGVVIVDGRQRRAATLEANRRLLERGDKTAACPCKIITAEERKLFQIAILTNEIRTGDSPLERAKKMQRLKDFGFDDEQVAIDFGCTIATVRSSLSLLECAPQVQHAVESGQVAATIATKLSKLSREQQKETLTKMIAEGATKGEAATRAAKGEKGTVSKVLSASKREKIAQALSNGAQEQLDKRDAEIARAVAATIARIAGNSKALGEWPEVMAVVEGVLKPIKKQKAKTK